MIAAAHYYYMRDYYLSALATDNAGDLKVGMPDYMGPSPPGFASSTEPS